MYCFVYFQDALDAAKILEPQHPEPLASLESADQVKQSFYNARIALQYTSISCITYPAKQLTEHTSISCQFNKQVYCFVYFQDALDAAKILEPQHPEPLASLESADQGKQSFYNARIALQYTSISCITYPAKQLTEHTSISC